MDPSLGLRLARLRRQHRAHGGHLASDRDLAGRNRSCRQAVEVKRTIPVLVVAALVACSCFARRKGSPGRSASVLGAVEPVSTIAVSFVPLVPEPMKGGATTLTERTGRQFLQCFGSWQMNPVSLTRAEARKVAEELSRAAADSEKMVTSDG